MNSTFWNLARKIASDLNTVQLSFAMLLGYVEGSEDGVPGFPMGDNVAENLPKIAHIGGDEDKALSPLDVLNYIARLPRQNITVKLYDVVNGSLQKAEDFGLIKRNPCRAIDRPTYDKQEKRPFELREQRAMLETLEGKHRELYFFLCCTGLRIGELLALDESKIDFARNVIRVTESAQLKTGERVSPKTKTSVRNVYFAPQLFEVFDIGNLGNYTYSGIKKAFCKAYHKLELAEGISLTHSCRHTYASLLNAAGVGMKKIQMQMGHADITTTMGIYTDLLQAGESSPIYEYIVQLKAVIDGHIL